MGQIRTGKLPKIRGWKQVIALLDSADSSSSEIAAATAKAAKDFFSQKRSDPALAFSYWLLTQITSRAKSENYLEEIKKIGLDVSKTKNAFDFLGRIATFTRAQIKLRGETFPISEFAQLSLREVLTETIGQQSQTLFGTTQEDVILACRKYSTPNQFAKLSRIYFSKVLNRVLQFFISKESPNKIGLERKFKDISDLSSFNFALEAYCFQSAKIVEEFAGGWYSKRNWQGEISEHDAKGFVSVAMEKLRAEIAREELAGQAING
jgi:hypothetical protein